LALLELLPAPPLALRLALRLLARLLASPSYMLLLLALQGSSRAQSLLK
jgi:hypothetical protein